MPTRAAGPKSITSRGSPWQPIPDPRQKRAFAACLAGLAGLKSSALMVDRVHVETPKKNRYNGARVPRRIASGGSLTARRMGLRIDSSMRLMVLMAESRPRASSALGRSAAVDARRASTGRTSAMADLRPIQPI